MLNNIEEKFDTKTSNVSVRLFSGATIEDMKYYSIPLLRKEPNVMIIHAGTNNVRTDTPSIIVNKLIKLQEYIIKIAPSTNKTNDLILNLTPENVTQHSRIVTTTCKGSSTPTKISKIIGRQIH